MFAQVNCDVFASYILDGIIEYAKTDDAVTVDNQYLTTQSGQSRLRNSTAVWSLLVSWRDGSEQWFPLSILKESNPLEVDELSVAHKIDKEPAFHWWVPYTLQKRDTIVSAMNARVKGVTHKYGIEVPRTFKEPLFFDDCNGNHIWRRFT